MFNSGSLPSFSWHKSLDILKGVDKEKKKYKKVNQYVLLKKLGEGSFSKVYLGFDTQTQKHYALKRVHLKELSRTISGIKQLQTEIEIMRKLKHPNIISLREVIHVAKESLVYIVLEFADCGNLESILQSDFKLTPIEIQAIFAQVVKAVAFLHSQNIVHQDLKPSNILMKSDGKVLISDFGIGHTFQSAAMVVGTPAYQAPEVIDDVSMINYNNYDPKISFSHSFAMNEGENGQLTSLIPLEEPANLEELNNDTNEPGKEDVWSLGVTLYEMNFHFLPFDGGNVFEIVRSISLTTITDPPAECDPDLWDLILKMLVIDPRQRISMKEIMQHPYYTNANHEIEPIVGLQEIETPRLDPTAKFKIIKGRVCTPNYSFVDTDVSIKARLTKYGSTFSTIYSAT